MVFVIMDIADFGSKNEFKKLKKVSADIEAIDQNSSDEFDAPKKKKLRSAKLLRASLSEPGRKSKQTKKKLKKGKDDDDDGDKDDNDDDDDSDVPIKRQVKFC